jgi:hypothetical protein
VSMMWCLFRVGLCDHYLFLFLNEEISWHFIE